MNNEDLNEDLFGGWLILDRADNNKNKKLIDYCKKKLAKNHTLSLDDNTYTFKPRKEKKINFKKGKEINLGGVTTTGKGYVGDPNQSLFDFLVVADRILA